MFLSNVQSSDKILPVIGRLVTPSTFSVATLLDPLSFFERDDAILGSLSPNNYEFSTLGHAGGSELDKTEC